jgi:hypothetical protein
MDIKGRWYRERSPAFRICLHSVVYQPQNQSSPTPTLIYIHGGGWVGGSKEGSIMSILPYLEMGWAVVNVEYRLVDCSISFCTNSFLPLRPRSGRVNLARRFNAGWRRGRFSRRVATVESERPLKRHYVTQEVWHDQPGVKTPG